MHFLHMVWLFGHMVGVSHEASVIVIVVMLIAGFALIFVFYKIFERDLFGDSD